MNKITLVLPSEATMKNNETFGLLPRWKRLIDEYKKYFSEIEVFTCDKTDFSEKLGAKHVSCPILINIPYVRPILYNIWLALNIRKMNGEIIRFFGSVYPIMPFLRLLSKAKFVLSYQYDFFTSTFKDFSKIKGLIGFVAERFSVRNVDKVLATTDELHTILRERHKVDSFVNPNFVDLSLFKPAKEENFLFYAGRIVKSKGIEVLIKMMKELKARDIHIKLLIAGIGDEEYYINEVKKEKLDDCITFLGSVNQDDVADYMARCKMFIFVPTSREGHPKALIEALASGATCIVSKVAGNVEVIQDGYNGILVEAGNHPELCNRVIEVLNDEEFRGMLKINARISSEKYDIGSIVKNEVNVYEKFES